MLIAESSYWFRWMGQNLERTQSENRGHEGLGKSYGSRLLEISTGEEHQWGINETTFSVKNLSKHVAKVVSHMDVSPMSSSHFCPSQMSSRAKWPLQQKCAPVLVVTDHWPPRNLTKSLVFIACRFMYYFWNTDFYPLDWSTVPAK